MIRRLHYTEPGLKIFNGDPEIRTEGNVLYVPRYNQHADLSFGIYTAYGRVHELAANRRGITSELLGQSYVTELDPLGEHPVINDGTYFYGGHIGSHFGHFITETLPRFWCDQSFYRKKRIVIHSAHTLDHLFSLSWVTFFFKALGLEQNQFVKFERPTRIRNITITGPAFNENHYAHKVYASLMNRIGAAQGDSLSSPHPIYLSKTRLRTGLFWFLGEDVIENTLKKAGFMILHPQRLPLSLQLSIFTKANIVCGIVGSAFHNSIFQPSPSGVGLCPGSIYSSNFMLMDAVNSANIKYFSISAEDHKIPPRDGFHHTTEISNPSRVAEWLIAYVQDRAVIDDTSHISVTLKCGTYSVIPHHGGRLIYNIQTGIMRTTSGQAAEFAIGEINAVFEDGHIVLHAADEEAAISPLGIHRQIRRMRFEVHATSKGRYGLFNRDYARYLSDPGDGRLVCDRMALSDWESFTLLLVS